MLKLKRFIGPLHLWVGLASGAFVFIISLAAALFVFEKELTDLFHRGTVFIEPSEAPPLPLAELFAIAQAAVPDEPVHSVDWEGGSRAYMFTTWKLSDKWGWTFWSEYDHWKHIYVNPHTGKVQGIVNQLYNPIYLFRMLHQQLLLRYEIGHHIVAVSTFLFFGMILSGLVLWWPRNKAALKQGLLIKTKSGNRRLNYDLHRVGGLYAYLFVLLLGATGLVWSYKWWTNGIYRLLGQDPATVFENSKPPPLPSAEGEIHNPLDLAWLDMQTRRPDWNHLSLSLPGAWGGDDKDLYAYLRFDGSNSGWDTWDEYRYHPQTGEAYHQFVHEEKSIGEKWRNSNYAIHVGSIYGWPSKILAFCVSLFAASLPVTGFLIWRGRSKRRGNARAQSPRTAFQALTTARKSV